MLVIKRLVIQSDEMFDLLAALYRHQLRESNRRAFSAEERATLQMLRRELGSYLTTNNFRLGHRYPDLIGLVPSTHQVNRG